MCFVLTMLAGDGREAEVTKDPRWRTAASAGSLGKVMKDGNCPTLAHLPWLRCSSRQLQSKTPISCSPVYI